MVDEKDIMKHTRTRAVSVIGVVLIKCDAYNSVRNTISGIDCSDSELLHTHRYIHAKAYTYIQIHTRTQSHARIHTTHTHKHTHIHIHTYSQYIFIYQFDLGK